MTVVVVETDEVLVTSDAMEPGAIPIVISEPFEDMIPEGGTKYMKGYLMFGDTDLVLPVRYFENFIASLVSLDKLTGGTPIKK